MDTGEILDQPGNAAIDANQSERCSFRRCTEHRGYHAVLQRLFDLKLRVDGFCGRVAARLRRLFRLGKAKKPAVVRGMRS